MNKKEIMELSRRLKKDACTFTRMCGCYVDAEKNKVVNFGQTFLNLEEEEYYKYLELAKKVFSGKVGNNLLTLDIPFEEESAGGKQQFLMGLRESRLKNDELLERFYDHIIETYSYAGNYLILVFHDAYDVPLKTTDNNKLDESEEVYEYLLCAICPVALSKAALGYRPDENRIGPRIRDWVVGAPDTGFVFPAFNDRSTDIHSLLFYTKDAAEPHTEFMEDGLGCGSKRTATEQKNLFSDIVKHAIGPNEEGVEEMLYDIQQKVNDYIEDTDDVFVDEETGESGIIAPNESGVAASTLLVYNTINTLKTYTDKLVEGIPTPSIELEDDTIEQIKEDYIFSDDFERDADNKIYIKWLEIN